MKRFLLFILLAFTVECTQVAQHLFNRDEVETLSEEVQSKEFNGRHPYLDEGLYADIAGLDLTAKSNNGVGRTKEWPSISVIETNTSRCVKSGGVVELEFHLPLASLSRDLSHSELAVEVEDAENAVSLLSSYILPGRDRDGEPASGQPRLRNKWLIYDASEVIKAFRVDNEDDDQRSGTVTVLVRLVGAPNRNATEICRGYSRKPPTMFLYHDFPSGLRRRLRRSPGSRIPRPPGVRIPRAAPVANQRRDPYGTECHLHPWTVDFNQIGMKWIIAPVLFQINYCHGVCGNPSWNLTDIRGRPPPQDKVTNHALLMARALSSLPPAMAAGLRAPSCVPTAYDGMNMIYIDRGNIVRVETFNQVIASSCGCA